ncbi:heme-binding protein 2-like [Lingula anatina]|uniref:Heme-binding protein 2-like n=1 Tax=Lingula anatina TaxID=7574 RepID=A0A1S3HUX7_LINAN|nr:heme-binding protein 2-like [Lingula anatina]|eukprot:XP_013389351.1 heme-binding protein 2-like [Lingula anatina]
MMKLAFTLMVLAVAGASAAQLKVQQGTTESKSPDFCNGLDCPTFTVLKTTKEYSIRQYDVSKWVGTSEYSMDWSNSTTTMFWRLFRYISGQNQPKTKVAMTAPVLTKIVPGQGPACESNFTMHFFIPATETNPPQPTDPKVSLSTLKSMKVYVRAFGGFPKEEIWTSEAQKLAQAINDNSLFYSDFWFTAGYDGPSKIINRHNEVWFVAKNDS